MTEEYPLKLWRLRTSHVPERLKTYRAQQSTASSTFQRTAAAIRRAPARDVKEEREKKGTQKAAQPKKTKASEKEPKAPA